jgi:predicted nuclease with TOPRIM domain
MERLCSHCNSPTENWIQIKLYDSSNDTEMCDHIRNAVHSTLCKTCCLAKFKMSKLENEIEEIKQKICSLNQEKANLNDKKRQREQSLCDIQWDYACQSKEWDKIRNEESA